MSIHTLTNAMKTGAWAILPGSYSLLESEVCASPRSRALMDMPEETNSENSSAGGFVYSVDSNGVAEFHVRGVLVKEADWIDKLFGMVSTTEIQEAFLKAVDYPAVKAILFRIDSPGGKVDGSVELAETVYNARGKKAIVALGDGLCASAAYWLASACDIVLATETTETGSIGVMCTVYDVTAMNEMAGLGVTIIKSGPYKSVGSPVESLSEDGRSYLQYMVDETHQMFVARVTRNRGKENAADVAIVADGRVFSTQDAMSLGLVDVMASRAQALEYAASYGGTFAPAETVMREPA